MYPTTHLEADSLRKKQGFAEPFVRPPMTVAEPSTMEVPVKVKEKALDLLRDWIVRSYDGDQPDLVIGCSDPEEREEFEQRVRHDMARELQRLRRPVKRIVTREDGIDVSYMTSAGVLELRRLINHSACRRTMLCLKCCRKADEERKDRPLACRCPSKLQRWVWKLLRQVERVPKTHPWTIVYMVLILRDVVQHWHDNRLGLEDPKAKRAKTAMDRDTETIEEYDDEDNIIGRHQVEPNDGTSRLAIDLRGWDRPSSLGRRTQRLAFCPECMHRDDPWFLVARTLPHGKATCTKLIDGTVCGTTEVPPPPRSGKVPTYIVRRTHRVHGEMMTIEHKFVRVRGRWYWDRTNERTHCMLNNQLERKWLATLKRHRSA
jgi:hypothetical protein